MGAGDRLTTQMLGARLPHGAYRVKSIKKPVCFEAPLRRSDTASGATSLSLQGQRRGSRQNVTGLRKRDPVGGHQLTKLNTPSGRNPQQISRSPYDILVKVVRVAVRIDNLPHHSNELTSAGIVQHFVEFAGKAIEIDRVAIDGDRFFEQATRGVIVEGELGLQDRVQGLSSGPRHFTIGSGNPHEQRGGRKPKIMIVGL
jgi:hypothetical protein